MPASPSISLTSAQQDVVNHRGGDLQVIACAGSGKTESISRLISGLITERVEPASIVAFTFTERAAAALKDRIVKRVGEALGAGFLDRLGAMFVGTIHGYCFRLLQDHVPRFGNFDVLDDHRHAGILSREYRNLGLSKLGSGHWRPIADFARVTDVIGNELISPSRLAGTDVGECYRAYREMLDRYHFLTFSLLISSAVEALADPRIFQRVHSPLRHLFVDEYQDVNPAQERLVEILAQAPVKLCVVGDDDQSIYQWRGSDVRNIITFTQRRTDAKTLPLEENRRSRPTIVARANQFAATIPGRLAKEMKPVRPPGKQEIVPWVAATEEEEAETVAKTVERLHALGYRYQDVAVLYRSVRTSAPPLIEALRDRHIPFSCAGRTGLFLQPEVSIFGEAFSWLADGDWRDERYGQTRKADLDHIVAGLHAQFGVKDPISDLRQYLLDWKAYELRSARSVSLVGDFYELLAKLGADQIDIDATEGSARFGAFARFSQILADYEHVTRRGRFIEEAGNRVFRGGPDRGKFYFQSLANYLLHYARDAYEDFEGETVIDLDAVQVLTVHQAKGLEWPVVFLPALVQGRFPSRMTGRAQEWLLPEEVFPQAVRDRYEGSETEERRLFYVALTRARDAAYLSWFERKKNRFKPSPFLLDVAGVKPTLRAPLPLPGPPEAAKEAEPPPCEVSFSDVALYQECGYRYRLANVFGFPQELAVELGYGKAIHHVLRQVAETARATNNVPDARKLAALVDEEFYLPFANAPVFERMHQSANRLVRNYVSEYSDDLRRVWATEWPFQLHVPGGIVSGRADVILDQEGGRMGSLAIVDYKVAEDPGREERYRQQLAVYTAAGRGEGLTVEAAYLHELRDGRRHEVDTSEATTREAVKAMTQSVGQIRGGVFPAQPEAARCKACHMWRVCPHRTKDDRAR